MQESIEMLEGRSSLSSSSSRLLAAARVKRINSGPAVLYQSQKSNAEWVQLQRGYQQPEVQCNVGSIGECTNDAGPLWV